MHNSNTRSKTIKKKLNKCKYTLQGLAYCFKNESSFLFVTICACFIIIFGICFDIDFCKKVCYNILKEIKNEYYK